MARAGGTPIYPTRILTPRERQVLRLVLMGMSRDQIAIDMKIKETTVKKNIDQLNKRLPGSRNYCKRALYGAMALKFKVMTVDELMEGLRHGQ